MKCGFLGHRVGCFCGTEARIDCRKMDGRKRCDTDASADAFTFCIAAGTECGSKSKNPAQKDRCEGSTLVFCDDGFETKMDCKALGFSTCGIEEVSQYLKISVCK